MTIGLREFSPYRRLEHHRAASAGPIDQNSNLACATIDVDDDEVFILSVCVAFHIIMLSNDITFLFHVFDDVFLGSLMFLLTL